MNKIILNIIFIVIILAVVLAVWLGFGKPADNTNQPINETKDMQVEILQEGAGQEAKVGDTVSVNYTGTLTNGTKFDSNVDPVFGHVEPFEFTLGQNKVIQGWELGVLGMKVGERRKLTIPPELAYGNRAVGSIISANSTLIFEIELLAIK